MDDTSVKCEIDGCFAHVHGAVRCRAHGGDPFYEWTTSVFGITDWSGTDPVTIQPVLNTEDIQEGLPNA